jgi:HEPN domain-containing protein
VGRSVRGRGRPRAGRPRRPGHRHARPGRLLGKGELGQIPADAELARRLLSDASRHLTSATATKSAGDLPGAYQLAYDALRKSGSSLLEAQGLRATSRGGHIAVQDAVIAQFGPSIRALRSFSRIRRARNSFEYPSAETPGPSEDDVDDAIRVAREVNDAAGRILESDILSPW